MFVYIAIIILLGALYLLDKNNEMKPLKRPLKKKVEQFTPEDYERDELNWSETLAEGVDPKIKMANEDFVENVRRFGGSAVRNFVIEEMSTNAAFTNFQGLRGPASYVPVRGSSRQQPSFNEEVLKTKRRHLLP